MDGSNLTADITITPPAGFQISTTNAPFTPANPITLTQTGGNVPATTIYARLNSTTLGVNTGNITNTSTGANNPNVSVTGKVLDAEPTTQGSITIGTVTNSTIQVTLTAGNGAKQLLAIHALTPVANNPVDGTTYTANTTYGAGSNLGANTYVVFNGVSGNGGTPITITGLAVATTYHFAVYEFNDGGGISGAENYLVTTPGTANATTLNIVNTYLWTGANGTLWTDPLNWLPVRTTPATNDSLLFVGPLTVTVTGVPAETIGYMGISLGSNVTLQAAVNNTTLNIGAGFGGEELELEAGSQLNISGANGYTINILTGNTSIIDGDMTFSGGAHKFTAADASGITFNTGSSFTAGTGFSSNPFGTTGTANSVVFVSGSTFNQIAGSNPFALAQPASIIVFQTGSLFRMLGNLIPSLSGRIYADLEIDNAAFSQSGTGGGALSIDNLTITQGLLFGINTTGGISIKGNITTVAGSTLNFLSASANTVTFNGAAAQTINIGGTLGWGANESLTINNAAGVEINRDISIGAAATLALTNGILKLNAPASMLTLSAGTTLTGGNSNASYVDGKVRKIGNTAFTFPIGKTAVGYVPIRISNFAGGAPTDQFDAEYFRGNPRLFGPITDPLINHISGCDWWTLDRTSGAATVDVTAYWNANSPCGATTYVDNLATLALVHFDGTNWNSSSVGFNPPPNGTIAAGDITWPGVTTFSPFALGSTATDNPLPITINYFTGVKQNGDHQLNWKVTCTNTPTVTMLLERSSDGRTYTTVNSITATALQCQQPFGYTDAAPAKGVNYYRLKLTDVNGKITYSSIVSLINASSGIDVLNIAPNPIVGGRFTLKVSAAKATNMELVITDMQGRAMQKQVLNAAAGFNTIPVDVRSLAAGTYQLYGFTAEGKTRVLRFVVQ
ncbi:MAG: T9SS type A sorting domain-containing protein [Ferruginibacter sp.]